MKSSAGDKVGGMGPDDRPDGKKPGPKKTAVKKVAKKR
jgi:hypothetical protein